MERTDPHASAAQFAFFFVASDSPCAAFAIAFRAMLDMVSCSEGGSPSMGVLNGPVWFDGGIVASTATYHSLLARQPDKGENDRQLYTYYVVLCKNPLSNTYNNSFNTSKYFSVWSPSLYCVSALS